MSSKLKPIKDSEAELEIKTPKTPTRTKREIRTGSPVPSSPPQRNITTPQTSSTKQKELKSEREIGSGFPPRNLSIIPRVSKVYKIVRKTTGTLGGNGYDGAIYGELTEHSMQRVSFNLSLF